jgi:IPT/TIG domain
MRIGFAAGVLALACTFLGSASATSPHRPVPQRAGGVIYRSPGHQSAAAHVAGAATAVTRSDGPIVDPTLQLTYHGGPVMHTQNVYEIFWQAPGWSAFPSGYISAVENWVQDVSADDGMTSNPFGAITQYTDTSGPGNYNVHYGGGFFVTDAPDSFQSDGCSGEPSPCISEQSLVDEIDNVRQAHGFSTGMTNQFAIVLPPGVTTCDIDGNCSNFPNFIFCAYHSYYLTTSTDVPSTDVVFLTLPYEQAQYCHSNGSQTQAEPNGQPDVVISAMSHEMRESATDPVFNGWFDANGNEADDKCYIRWGFELGFTGGGFNQLINGHPYETQLEWSNALKGCYQMGAPTISNVSPASGVQGATVGITGANFFAEAGSKPAVRFNGVLATTETVDSPTHLTVTVPAGRVTGEITVTGVGGVGTSAQTFSQAPAVSALSVSSGHAGDVITVDGTGFFGVSSVKFGGVPATFGTVATDGTSLKATVPTAALDGDVTVMTGGGSASAPTPFTVLPNITSFTPSSGPAGTSVTINGSGFGAFTGVTFVGDGDADGINVSHTATQVVVQVPANAKVGPITVYTHSGTPTTATSSASFTPLLSVSGLNRSSAKPGDSVVVNGANFTAHGPVSVSVNGVVACTSCAATPTTVTFSVPNTVSGQVTVTNADGTVTAPSSLAVVPRIDSMTVNGGYVTLRGAGFAGTTSVAFGGGTERALFTIGATGTTLQVTVPASATTGAIAVTNAGGTTLTASNFVVAPTIASFAPVSVQVGATIGITGAGLDTADRVDFAGGFSATPTNVTGTSLQVVVPAGAQSGVFSVHTSSGSVSSGRPLTITFSVSRFSPAKADYGATVTITGSALTGVTSVLFNGVPGTNVTVVDDSHVTVTVPASGSLSGQITVVKGGVSVHPSGLFTLFGLHSATPNAGPAGTTVVLSGVGLSAVNRVTFSGGVTGTFTVNSDTQITVTVPVGATNGQVTVSVPGATASVPYSVT